MKKLLALWTMISALLIGGLLHAAPVQGGAPTEQLKTTIEAVLKLVKDEDLKRPEKFKERRALLRKTIVERFDFNEMSKRSLAAQWAKRTPEEKKEFVAMFTNLLENPTWTGLKRIPMKRSNTTAKASITTTRW